MAHIFFSYSRKDDARAAQIIKGLESYGFTVWWDWKINGGEVWRREIMRRLQDCGTIVVLWTENSVRSDAVVEEANVGKKRQVLVPIYLEPCELPYGFGEINYVSLEGWDGRLYGADFQRAVRSIQAMLEGFTPILTMEERREILELRRSSAHEIYSLTLAGEKLDLFVASSQDVEGIEKARAASEAEYPDNAAYLTFVLESYLAPSASVGDAVDAYNAAHPDLPVSSLAELAQAVLDAAVPSYRKQYAVG